MSMHLIRGMTSLNTSSKKKKVNAKQQRALAEHEKWLKKMDLHPTQIKTREIKRSKVASTLPEIKKSSIPSHGNGFAPIKGNKSVFDSAWKKMYEDDPVMAEREELARMKAENKKSRIAPAYSKGAYQYISEETDLKDIGKKK